jgi:RNA polymerase sigma factor (sigma-70 family)
MKTGPSNQPTLEKDSGIFQAFLQNESALKRFLQRFLYKKEDIDEISQETFLRAYKATQGREIDSPKAYIFQVARTLAYTELSRKSRKLTDYLEEALDAGVAATDLLEDEYVAQQKVTHYFDAIADLPPQCRRVFLMRKVQGMPHKAISASLGISTSAVEKHIAIGTERCKRFVESRDIEGSDLESSTTTDSPSGLSPNTPTQNPQTVRGQHHEG